MILLAFDPVLLLAAGAAVAGVAFAIWWFSPYQQNLRALRAAPMTRIADAPDGQLVRIAGRLAAHEKIVHAPLSGRACAHFEVVVEERVQSGKNSRWKQLFSERDTEDFVVEDESGRAIVETDRLEVALVQDHHARSGTLNDATPELEALLSRHGHSSTNFLGLNRAIRYREGVLEPGEEVAVLGLARWEDDPELGALDPSGGYRGSARKKRLRIVSAHEPVRASDDPKAFT